MISFHMVLPFAIECHWGRMDRAAALFLKPQVSYVLYINNPQDNKKIAMPQWPCQISPADGRWGCMGLYCGLSSAS